MSEDDLIRRGDVLALQDQFYKTVAAEHIAALPVDDRVKALVEALKAQEAWEAEIIMNADWSRGTVLLRQEDHDALIEVQSKRNAALAAWEAGK